MTNDELVDTLNELVKINNDRIQGFEKAADDIEDPQLASIFRNLTAQSRKFRSQLADDIGRMGGLTPGIEETSTGSKIHRTWIDIKSTFTGKDRNSVLDSCVFGENSAVEEYEEVLEQDEMPAYLRDTLTAQLAELRQTRDQIVTLRDVTE